LPCFVLDDTIVFSVLKSINILIGRQVFPRALPGHQTMSWHDIAKCHGCTTIVDASCHNKVWKGYCSTCWINPELRAEINEADVRAMTSAGIVDRKLTEIRAMQQRDFGQLQQQVDNAKVDAALIQKQIEHVQLGTVTIDAVRLGMEGLRELNHGMQAQIDGMQADANQRQQEMDAMQRQTEDLRAQIDGTKAVDLQQKLVSAQVVNDAVRLDKVQVGNANVDAVQLVDMQGLREIPFVQLVEMQAQIDGMHADAARQQHEMYALLMQMDEQRAMQIDLNEGKRAQIDGNKARLADADRRQHEMDAMVQQMDDLQHQLRAVTESLPPPPPPTSARPNASSGSSSPPQPPPPPSGPPHPPPAALHPVLAPLAISDEPRRPCCPQCRSTTDGTTCPVNPFPNWSDTTDYIKLHWGMTQNNVSLSDHFQDHQGVSLNPISWMYQLPAIEEMLFFNGGVDRAMKSEMLRCIEVGLGANTLEVIWHRTNSASHIVLGLRCRECGFIVGAEWSSPLKFPIVRPKVDAVQVALACWLGVDLQTSLNDGPRAQ
jgi:hypothetical protein